MHVNCGYAEVEAGPGTADEARTRAHDTNLEPHPWTVVGATYSTWAGCLGNHFQGYR